MFKYLIVAQLDAHYLISNNEKSNDSPFDM